MKEIYTSNHMWKLFENFLVDICRVMKAHLGIFINPHYLFSSKVPKSTNLLLSSMQLTWFNCEKEWLVFVVLYGFDVRFLIIWKWLLLTCLSCSKVGEWVFVLTVQMTQALNSYPVYGCFASRSATIQVTANMLTRH